MDTPLMIALKKKDYYIAKVLIENGADVNAKDAEGDTPLMMVKDHNIAKLLIEKGADVNAKDSFGYTPLMFATLANGYDIAKLLIRKGADVNAKDAEGDTPLMMVKDHNIAKLLIEKGADVNAKDSFGYTPLMFATLANYDIAKLLIEKGADVNAKNNDGKTALDIARKKGNSRIEKLLLGFVDEGLIKRIKKEAGEKKLVYKWQPICKSLGDKELPELRNLAKLHKIASADSKSKRVLCKELAEKYEKKMSKPLQCENDSTIGGDDVNDIPKPLLYKLKEGGKVFCFNILELIKLDKNPYTRNPLPKEDIQKKYEKLEKLLIKSKLSKTLLDQIKELGILTKNKDALVNLKITNILSKLKYPKSVEYFKSLSSVQLKKLIRKLSEYELMRISPSEVEKVEEAQDKLNALISIVSQKLDIQDQNSETRAVIFEDVFNTLDASSASPRSSSGSRRSTRIN